MRRKSVFSAMPAFRYGCRARVVILPLLAAVPILLWSQERAEAQTAAPPGAATGAQPSPGDSQRDRLEQQLQELLSMRREMQRAMNEFDSRIGALEAQLVAPQREPGARLSLTAPPNSVSSTERAISSATKSGSLGASLSARRSMPKSPSMAASTAIAKSSEPASPFLAAADSLPPAMTSERFDPADIGDVADWAAFEPGKGIVAARGNLGELSFGINTYFRYLNQENLKPTYTDSFGRTFPFDKRQDFMVNREQLAFRGWLFDEDFQYSFFAWTENTNMGNFSQVVLGGNFLTHLSDAVNLRYGLFSLPTTRSTSQTVPNWLKFDHRTMADEFFRGSYTMALGADGKIADGLEYRSALGNNLSTLGISTMELDNDLNTCSLVLWWMPTTHEFGPAKGFGDYEEHQELATLFGIHYTHSREDAQGQPPVGAFENAQLRLSDGTLLFSPDPFMTGGRLERATYDMLDLNAGMKYQGWSLEGEYYFRKLSNFRTIGEIPVEELFDHGFQLQASTMLVPKTLQAYVHYSKIFGEYGDPWEFGMGTNWFPYKQKPIRVNFQGLWEQHAASGSPALPYQVGADGWIWSVDAGFSF